MANEKKKASFKDILLGGSNNDNAFRIIYFNIVTYTTQKGIETYVNVLYGDDTQAIFTNMLPLMGIMFSYNAEIDAPYIKISKSFMPGRSKAEIILPTGYSFMAPHTPTVISAMPEPKEPAEPKIVYVPQPVAVSMPQSMPQSVPVQQVVEESDDFEDKEVISTDEVMRLVRETEESVSNHRNEDGSYTYIDPDAGKKKVENNETVIPDLESFDATFDTDVLQAKVAKFMSAHEKKEPVQTKTVKEIDPRTIAEVKRETVDDEMERLLKNDEQMRKLEEAANKDAKGK
jgi:hypothetical protein